MNIGIFSKKYEQTFGGAYAFEQEILSNLGSLSHTFEVALGIEEAKKLAKMEEIDAVWFPTPWYLAVKDTPYVATIWDIQHRVQPWFPEVGEFQEWNNREGYYAGLASRAYKITVCSSILKERVSNFYRVEKSRINVLGLPTPDMGQPVATDLDFYEEKGIALGKYIIYPAQFWAHKNHMVILKAMKVFKNWKLPQSITAVFTGADKGNEKYIRECAKDMGLEDDIKFLGFVDKDVLRMLYQNALALVYASKFGPQNLPPLEATAVGCPVMMANVDGAKEQMGSHAVYFEPDDYTQLAVYIREMLDEGTATMMKNMAISKPHTSGKDYVEKISHVFDELEVERRLWV